MKEVYEKKTITATTVLYEAIDGRRFGTKEECMKYEGTARALLKSRFNQMVISVHNAWDLCFSYEDNAIYILKFATKEDAEDLIKLYYIENSHLLKDSCVENRKAIENRVFTAFDKGHFFMVGENEEGGLYLMGSVEDTIARLKQACKKQKD